MHITEMPRYRLLGVGFREMEGHTLSDQLVTFTRCFVAHCHVNRKIAGQMTMAATVHAATVAWRHVSIA